MLPSCTPAGSMVNGMRLEGMRRDCASCGSCHSGRAKSDLVELRTFSTSFKATSSSPKTCRALTATSRPSGSLMMPDQRCGKRSRPGSTCSVRPAMLPVVHVRKPCLSRKLKPQICSRGVAGVVMCAALMCAVVMCAALIKAVEALAPFTCAATCISNGCTLRGKTFCSTFAGSCFSHISSLHLSLKGCISTLGVYLAGCLLTSIPGDAEARRSIMSLLCMSMEKGEQTEGRGEVVPKCVFSCCMSLSSNKPSSSKVRLNTVEREVEDDLWTLSISNTPRASSAP
mmetsp:Transcript_90696/g.132659  ORF Transcript_90696/g.132659 Transcript_90696/m.132659 type:complete len:285 (-) Transcript_90696:301-1155(-)